MYIDTFAINNFCNIRSRVGNARHGLFICGLNGVGKSNINEALKLALTGENRYTSGRNKKAAYRAMVRDGERTASIMVKVVSGEDVAVAEVLLSKDGIETTLTDQDGQVYDTHAEFYEALGVDFQNLKDILDISEAHSQGRLGKLLERAFTSRVTLEDILPHCGAHDVWLEGHKHHATDAAGWRAFGERWYKARTGVNREIKAIKTRLADIPKPRTAISEKSDTQLEADVYGAEKAHQALRDKVVALQAVAGQRVTEEEVQAVRVEVAKANEVYADTEKRMTKANKEVRRIESGRISQEGEYTAVLARLKWAENGECPYLGKCKITPTLDAQKAAEKQLEAVKALIAKLGDSLCIADREAKDIEKHLIKAQQTASEKTCHLQALEGRKAEQDAMASEDVATLEAKLSKAETATSEARELLAIERDRLAWNSATQDLERLSDEKEHLDWAVKAFRDGELLGQLGGGDDKDRLLAAMNEELQAFGLALSIPDGEPMLTSADDAAQPKVAAWWSTGQRKAVEFCMAMVLSNNAENYPVLLDEVGAIDGVKKSALLKRLKRAEGSVIVNGAWAQGIEATEDVLKQLTEVMKPVGFVWLEGEEK
ncbi:MAG: AAA family ATPase [Chloroflexi bacterium]|nr:AAA family ATPase [Chloroflexota bacterium]